MISARTTPVSPDVLSALRQDNHALRDQVQSLKTQLAWFKRQLFGNKSEKRLIVDPAIQADLLAGLGEPSVNLPVPATEKISYSRRKQRRDDLVNDTGLRFDDSVPVHTIHLDPAQALSDVPENEQVFITEKVSYRLAQRPGSYVVIKYIRSVIKHVPSSTLITAPAPDNVLERSIADVSFLAGMLVDKFVYHLPLHRQHLRLQQCGIDVSRSTLTNLAGRAIDLLVPIFDAQHAHALRSRVLAMDETFIKAGLKSPGKLNQGYLWPVYGEDDEVVFTYTPTRAGHHVGEILGDAFNGVLISDGYDAYARYASTHPSVTHAQCWAHTRRYFERALDAEPQAAEALEIIGALYRIEAHIRECELTQDDKRDYRLEHSTPIIESFWHWCKAQCQRHDLLPRNPLTKALKYAMARTDSLQVFLSDADVAIDTNHLERALRPIPMGRKSWMFCWSELGAHRLAVIQSLLITCRLHDINPHTYLVDVLQRISQHPASRTIELTPRVWKTLFASHPLTSDLDRQDTVDHNINPRNPNRHAA